MKKWMNKLNPIVFILILVIFVGGLHSSFGASDDSETVTPQGKGQKKSVSSPNKKAETASSKDSADVSKDGVNAAFGYTHHLPSPINIPGGTVVIGTTTAWAPFDFLQFSTNTIQLFMQIWNVQAKVPLVEYPTFIVSAYLGFMSINLNSYDDRNLDYRIDSWQPGLVTGFEITPDMAFFVGGNFNSTNHDLPPVYYKSGYATGAELSTEWSWMYNPVHSRLSNNALSLGVTYDLTYSMVGFGVTHHWPAFQLGLHYIPSADRYKVVPTFNIASGFTF